MLLSQSRQKSHYEDTIDMIKEFSLPPLQRNHSIEAIHTHLKRNYDEVPSTSTLRRILKPYTVQKNKAFSNIEHKKKTKQQSSDHTKRSAQNAPLRLTQFGHTYADFQHYIAVKPVSHVEIDCISGIEANSKVVFTLLFKNSNMQLGYLIPKKTSEYVVAALDRIEEKIGTEMFREYLGILLTDNQSEFSDIEGIERSIFGGKRAKVFYCNLSIPGQKGGCEKNHTMFRKVLKKSAYFDRLFPADVALVVNHINSYPRPKFNNTTPYEVAMNVMHSDFFILLDLRPIDPYDVDLTPNLVPHIYPPFD